MDNCVEFIKEIILSSPETMVVSKLASEFRNLVGYKIPYEEAGFSDLTDYLDSFTDEIYVIGIGDNALVRVCVTQHNIPQIDGKNIYRNCEVFYTKPQVPLCRKPRDKVSKNNDDGIVKYNSELNLDEDEFPALGSVVETKQCVEGFKFPEDVVQLGADILRIKTDFNIGDKIRLQAVQIFNEHRFSFVLFRSRDALTDLFDRMQEFYSDNWYNYRVPEFALQEGMYVAGIYNDEYYRAEIVNMFSNNRSIMVELNFVDYGNLYTVEMSEVFYLYEEFSRLPAQCIHGMFISPITDLPLYTTLLGEIQDIDTEQNCYVLTLINSSKMEDIIQNLNGCFIGLPKNDDSKRLE